MADILVMEDDSLFGGLLCQALQEAEHSTLLVMDATAAIRALESNSVDVVVTDMTVHKNGRAVPDGGLVLISSIKQKERETGEQGPPVIAISGAYKWEGMQFILQTAEAIGADAVLEKPFDFDDLLHVIDKECNGRQPKLN